LRELQDHMVFHTDHDYTSGQHWKVTAARALAVDGAGISKALGGPPNSSALIALAIARTQRDRCVEHAEVGIKCRSKQNIYAFPLRLRWAPSLETGEYVGSAAGRISTG
jgi:hypothetical protein